MKGEWDSSDDTTAARAHDKAYDLFLFARWPPRVGGAGKEEETRAKGEGYHISVLAMGLSLHTLCGRLAYISRPNLTGRTSYQIGCFNQRAVTHDGRRRARRQTCICHIGRGLACVPTTGESMAGSCHGTQGKTLLARRVAFPLQADKASRNSSQESWETVPAAEYVSAVWLCLDPMHMYSREPSRSDSKHTAAG